MHLQFRCDNGHIGGQARKSSEPLESGLLASWGNTGTNA